MGAKQPPAGVEHVWDMLENSGILRSPQPLKDTFRVSRAVTMRKARLTPNPYGEPGDMPSPTERISTTGGLSNPDEETFATLSQPDQTVDSMGITEASAHLASDETFTSAAPGHATSGSGADFSALLPILNDDAPFSEDQLEALSAHDRGHDVSSTFTTAGVSGALQATKAYPFLPILQVVDSTNDDGQTDLRFRMIVGQGGAGQIVLAEQRSLFREVAIKRVKAQAEVPHPEEMLLQEGMVTGHLEHPNIIPVHAMGLDAERSPVLVMKYVEGVAWSALLEDDAHPFWEQIKSWSREPMIRHLEILLEICHAVEFAHSKGILHRDIKPSNVMLGAFGEVYLLDWGLGYALDKTSPLAPLMDALMPTDEVEDTFYGTPTYMAPEMVEDVSFLGPWTDVYLLGGVLYEIMHGKPPNQGGTIEDVILDIFDETPPDFAPHCPAELVRICRKALAFDPDERYQQVAEFREELVDFLQHRASLTLSDEAWRTLQRLQDAIEQGDIESYRERDLPLRRWYDTCHFGFLQALREWPHNPEAKRGLQEAFRAMFSVELAMGHLESAELLLEDLEASLGAPDDSTAAMRAALDQALAKQSRLQQLQQAADFTVARHQRVRLMIGMGVAATLFALIRLWLGEAADLKAGYRRALGFVGLTTAALSVGLFLGRKALFQNDANRRFVLLLIMCCATVTVHRGFRAFYRHPLHETFMFDLILLGCMVAVAAMTLRGWLAWIAAMLLAGAAVGWLWPGPMYHIMTLCIAASWLLCGYFWSRDQRVSVA